MNVNNFEHPWILKVCILYLKKFVCLKKHVWLLQVVFFMAKNTNLLIIWNKNSKIYWNRIRIYLVRLRHELPIALEFWNFCMCFWRVLKLVLWGVMSKLRRCMCCALLFSMEMRGIYRREWWKTPAPASTWCQSSAVRCWGRLNAAKARTGNRPYFVL